MARLTGGLRVSGLAAPGVDGGPLPAREGRVIVRGGKGWSLPVHPPGSIRYAQALAA